MCGVLFHFSNQSIELLEVQEDEGREKMNHEINNRRNKLTSQESEHHNFFLRIERSKHVNLMKVFDVLYQSNILMKHVSLVIKDVKVMKRIFKTNYVTVIQVHSQNKTLMGNMKLDMKMKNIGRSSKDSKKVRDPTLIAIPKQLSPTLRIVQICSEEFHLPPYFTY